MVALSHTNPEYPLEQHLIHTRNIALRLMPACAKARKYGLESIVRISTEAHDLGKATTWFQNYLFGKYNGDLKEHSFISACFAYYAARRERLERWQRVATYFIVLGHHGGLEGKEPSTDLDSDILRKQAENIASNKSFPSVANLPTYAHVEDFLNDASENPDRLIKDIRKDIRKIRVEAKDVDAYENVKRFLTTKMAYSLLATSDTISAALRTDNIESFVGVSPPTWQRLDKHVEKLPKHRKIDYVRSAIYEQSKEFQLKKGIYVLELPTGAGKTFTGMRIATTAEKPIIYTLPYTSIIDQTVGIFQQEDLYDSDVMPYHHLAVGQKDWEKVADEYQRKAMERLVEGWFSPITITTYEQVMYALTWDLKRFSQRMQAIGRSAIIFDEIQALPHSIWDATWYVLRALSELFDVPILIMSATIPQIPKHAKRVVQKLPIHPPERSKKIFVRRVFEYRPDIDNVGKIAELVVKLSRDYNKVLCVVNTRCDAYKTYTAVKKLLEKEDTGKREVILLSTYIPPEERLKRINRIKEDLKEWIVISTQVIEAGVDIDANILIRDIAPLDSIIQSAGRCNRNGEQERGRVIITKIKDDSGRIRARHVYDSTILEITQEILSNMPKNADDVWMEKQMRKYYKNVYERIKKEEEMGSEGIPMLMGKMCFQEVRERFKIIEEIPAFQIILADRCVEQILEDVQRLKEQTKHETNYENRIGIVKKLRSLRRALEQKAVPIYRPSSDNSKAQRMLEYLQEKARDALECLGMYDNTFVLWLDRLPQDLRRKTEEVGISWICEAEDIDSQKNRFV